MAPRAAINPGAGLARQRAVGGLASSRSPIFSFGIARLEESRVP
jgi:hypothetical protein